MANTRRLETNTRQVLVDGVEYDVPVEAYSRILADAELTVMRRQLVEDLAAVDDPPADRRLEAAVARHGWSVSDLREHAGEALAAWDRREDLMRVRLRLPPRRDS